MGKFLVPDIYLSRAMERLGSIAPVPRRRWRIVIRLF
jgi:hypothetical protein